MQSNITQIDLKKIKSYKTKKLINTLKKLTDEQIKTDPNLQGGVLTFEKQDDGTYKVLKNGGGTGYYTTGLAAAFYMKTLVSVNSQISQQKTETNIKDTMSENYNNHKIEKLQPDIEIIKDMEYFVDHRQDIVIPKGKHLYIDGQKTMWIYVKFLDTFFRTT